MNDDTFTDKCVKDPFSYDVNNNIGVNSLLSSGSIHVDEGDEYFEMTGSDLLLHHSVDNVTPSSLIKMLSIITKRTPSIVVSRIGVKVHVPMPYGNIYFSNKDEQTDWSDESSGSVLIEVVYSFFQSSYIDPRIQSQLNRNLLSGRVVVTDNNELEYRTTLSFRGGRTVENALWDVVTFSQEAASIINA